MESQTKTTNFNMNFFTTLRYVYTNKKEENRFVEIRTNKPQLLSLAILSNLIDQKVLNLMLVLLVATLIFLDTNVFIYLSVFIAGQYIIYHIQDHVELVPDFYITSEEMRQIFHLVPLDVFLKQTDIEKMFWLNYLIKMVWKPLSENLQRVCIGSSLGYGFSVSSLDLGENPPSISSINTSGISRDGFLDVMTFNVEYSYNSSDSMKVQFVWLTKFIRGGIKRLQLKGSIKVVIKYIKWFSNEDYTISEINICFLGQPMVFKCSAVGLLHVLYILKCFNAFMEDIVAHYILYPNHISIKFPEPDQQAFKIRRPVVTSPFGLVTVDILEADLLPCVNVSLLPCRNPNPYVVVNILKEKFFSHTVMNEESPWFSFKCSTCIPTDFMFQIGVEISDNTFGKAAKQGTGEMVAHVFLDVNEHDEDSTMNGQSRWISLPNTERSRLHYRISCFKLGSSHDDISKSLKLASFGFPVGVLTVFVDSAIGLNKLTRGSEIQLESLNPFVIVRVGNITLETPMSDQANTPIWEQDLNFPVYNPNLQKVHVEICVKISSTLQKVIGTILIPIDDIFATPSPQLALDKEYSLQGIAKGSYIRLLLMYRAAIVPPYFIKNYQRGTKVAEQETSKDKEIRKEKELVAQVQDKQDKMDSIFVKLRISWPNRSVIDVHVLEIAKIPLRLKHPSVYVVVHLRHKQLLQQIKRTKIVGTAKNIRINDHIVFKGIKKNLRALHFRVSVHLVKRVKKVFNKIAEGYFPFPPLSPGPDAHESFYKLDVTYPFLLAAAKDEDEDGEDEDEEKEASDDIAPVEKEESTYSKLSHEEHFSNETT